MDSLYPNHQSLRNLRKEEVVPTTSTRWQVYAMKRKRKKTTPEELPKWNLNGRGPSANYPQIHPAMVPPMIQVLLDLERLLKNQHGLSNIRDNIMIINHVVAIWASMLTMVVFINIIRNRMRSQYLNLDPSITKDPNFNLPLCLLMQDKCQWVRPRSTKLQKMPKLTQ